MKEKSLNSLEKSLLHYLREASKFHIEKYLNFWILDKKNVQNLIAENVLTDEKIPTP